MKGCVQKKTLTLAAWHDTVALRDICMEKAIVCVCLLFLAAKWKRVKVLRRLRAREQAFVAFFLQGITKRWSRPRDNIKRAFSRPNRGRHIAGDCHSNSLSLQLCRLRLLAHLRAASHPAVRLAHPPRTRPPAGRQAPPSRAAAALNRSAHCTTYVSLLYLLLHRRLSPSPAAAAALDGWPPPPARRRPFPNRRRRPW